MAVPCCDAGQLTLADECVIIPETNMARFPFGRGHSRMWTRQG